MPRGDSGKAGRSSSRQITAAQALDLARDSMEGANDPTVVEVLENALARLWSRIQARPNSYVMTRGEFAVFNYFQSRFEGNELAISAKKRFWDHQQASSG